MVWLQKTKYADKAKLCSMDTESIMTCEKREYMYLEIAKDAEARSDTSNYQ